jgi:transposase
MAKQVAEEMGYSPYWIGQIAKRYNRDGPAGMRSRARANRWLPSVLTSAQKEALRELLRGNPPEGQPRWSGKLVATWMSEQAGRPITTKLGWNYLQRFHHTAV